MERIGIGFTEKGQRRIAYQLATQYDNPLNALREYFTNSLDATDESREREWIKKAEIEVLLIPEARRLIINDNALGMNEQRLRELPQNIGESDQYEKIDRRGEKGVDNG